MIIKLKKEVDSDFLLPDKMYVVFAIYISSSVDLMVLGENNSFPVSVSSSDVDIVDDRLSKYWVYGHCDTGEWSAVISFPEWAEDFFFYQNLVEGKRGAGQIFRKYENNIQNEFADPSIVRTAGMLKESWYQCPVCEEAWEYDASGEVIVCPSCKEKLRRS